MHGLGNDFIIIDSITHPISSQTIPIKALSNRFTGIGFDQLLLIEPSSNAEFACRFFNADGSEAEQCGNGVRCVARYIHENELSTKQNFNIETKAGIVKVSLPDYDHIEVSLTTPLFFPNQEIHLPNNHGFYEMFIVSLGNPHAIIKVPSVEQFPVKEIGHLIATHSKFPEGINVGFMEIVNPSHIRLRTFERGVGETFACGSNACAAVVAGISNQLLDKKVQVELALGSLDIRWDKNDSPVTMIGPAARVFQGHIVV